MIEEGGRAVTDLLTRSADIILDGHVFHFLSAMLAHEMEDAICLCECLIGTARAFQGGRILLGMLGGDMDGESLCVEKLFLTCGARVRQMPLMFLHVIVHGILVLLDLRADSTDKLASSILLISVRHLYLITGATGASIFPRANIASRSDYYDRHSSRCL